MEKFDPIKYNFEIHYETGIENPTWTFPSDSESWDDIKYIISCPEIASHRDIDNDTIYKIKIYDDESTFEGIIPSDEYAHDLFIRLKMKDMKHVRREMGIEDILNKNESR